MGLTCLLASLTLLLAFGSGLPCLAQANQPPTVKLVDPSEAASLPTGRAISYAIEVEDPEDGYSIYDEIPASEIFLEVGIAPSEAAAREMLKAEPPPGLALIKANDCLSCHQVRSRHMGPSFLEVAERRRGDIRTMVHSIKQGSRGQWGDVAVMPPHPTLTDEEVRAMADWIAGLPAHHFMDLLPGTSGILRVDPAFSGQYLWIRASYVDHGSPAKQGSASSIFHLK